MTLVLRVMVFVVIIIRGVLGGTWMEASESESESLGATAVWAFMIAAILSNCSGVKSARADASEEDCFCFLVDLVLPIVVLLQWCWSGVVCRWG